MIYDLTGNICESLKNGDFYIEKLTTGEYYFKGDNIFYELDSNCVTIYDSFQNLLFPDSELYYEEQAMMPIWSYSAGHDSDFAINKAIFERLLDKEKSDKYHRHLYLADCHSIISALQDRLIFVKSNFVDFYKNLSSLSGRPMELDSVIWTTGQNTSLVFSSLYNVFITLYSTFDLVTKIAFELQNFHQSFLNYPKLKCAKILYGAKNRINIENIENTIYEQSDYIKAIVNIRNELIHNGGWEMNPKVFMKFEKEKVIEKWILFPDMNDGNIISHKNRKRFFSNGDKINELLPEIVLNVLNRINNTIVQIKESIKI